MKFLYQAYSCDPPFHRLPSFSHTLPSEPLKRFFSPASAFPDFPDFAGSSTWWFRFYSICVWRIPVGGVYVLVFSSFFFFHPFPPAVYPGVSTPRTAPSSPSTPHSPPPTDPTDSRLSTGVFHFSLFHDFPGCSVVSILFVPSSFSLCLAAHVSRSHWSRNVRFS